MDTKATPMLEEGTFVLPPHLFGNFEKAETQLKAFYGVSPSVIDLVRLWIACATASAIRDEFEQAVLERTQKGNGRGDFDDDF